MTTKAANLSISKPNMVEASYARQGIARATGRTQAGRGFRSFVLAVCIVAYAAGGPGSQASVTGGAASAVTGAAAFTRGALELSAVKLYRPVRWEDGHIDQALPFTFEIPRELQVTIGNAGNGTAVLSLAGAASGSIECTYRGASYVSHPTTPAAITDGTRYRLESCAPEYRAGDAVTALRFRLHVTDGDAEHAMGATGASVRLSPPGSAGTFPVALPARPFAEFQISNPVGTLDGQSQVRANGEFSHDITIPVPPGRAGLQPSLSLQYRSRGGDGLLGVGWHLTGLSEIHRCASTIASEGHTDGVHYNAQDRFCLDGAKLFAVHGAYGADGTEYRTEEDSFQRIISRGPAGSPSRFTVSARDGRILEFGTAVLRERFVTKGDGQNSSGGLVTHAWLLSEISNRSGSKIRFTYNFGDGYPLFNPEITPREILYVRDVSSGTELERAVRFEYQDRPDPSFEWVSGVRLERKLRLKGIRTFVGLGSAGVRPVAELRLGYEQSARTKRSLLTSVTRCDGGQATSGAQPVCSQPKLFGWDKEVSRPAWTVVLDAPNPDLQAPNVNTRATRVLVADLDGDGSDDVVYQVPSTWPKLAERVRWGFAGSLTQPVTLSSPRGDWNLPLSRAVDIDSDGKTEILAAVFDSGTGYQLVRADRDTSSFAAVGPFFQSIATSDFTWPGVVDFADADGDGLLDAFAGKIRHPNVRTENIAFYRNQGGRFTTPLDTGKRYCSGGQLSPRAADPTGDGRGMWLLSQCPTKSSGALHAMRMDRAGNVVSTEEDVNLAVPSSGAEFVLADLNGDGLKDAVIPFRPAPPPGDPGGPVTDILVRWNTGHGFALAEILRDPNASAFGFDVRTGLDSGLRVADINGDGRDDLIQFVSGAGGARTGIWVFETQHVNRNDRTAFHSYKVSNDPGRFDMTFGWKSANLGDFDGDGMVDILAIPNQPVSTFRTYLNTDLRPDILTLIADSKSVASQFRSFTSERIVYGSDWSDGDRRESLNHARTAIYPQRSITRGLLVVKEHYRTIDGLENRTLYSYSDARADMLGRGFLGFSVQRVLDETRNTRTELRFDLDTRDGTIYPFAGRPTYQSEILTDTIPTFYERTRISAMRYRLHRSLDSASVYSIMPEDTDVVTTEKRSGVSQTLRHDVLIQRWDLYGNETARFEVTDEGKNTVRTLFAHDATPAFRAAWLINLPARRSVTSAATGIVEARERLTLYEHDAIGQLREVVIEPDGDDSVRQQLHYDYTRGAITHVCATAAGASPRDIGIVYDNDGVHPRRITDSLGHVTQVFIDPGLGVTTQRVDANGISTWYSYDGFGRLRTEFNEGGAAYSLDYAETARGEFEITRHVRGGGDSIQHFDSRGHLVGESSLTVDGHWASTALTHDKLGRLVRRSRPLLETSKPVQINGGPLGTTFVYDKLDRVVRTTTPDNRSVSFSYNGRTTVIFDEINHQVTSVADSRGRVVERRETVSGLGTRSSTFRYGQFGVLAGISHSHQAGRTFKYDALGRRTNLTDPDGGSRSFAFNAFGEVTEERDAAGRAVVYERDSLGRAVSRADDRGVALYTWDTALRGIGSPAAVHSADGILTRFAYDFAGRQERETTTVAGVDYTMTRGYDSAGRLGFKGFPVKGAPLHVSYGYSNGELLAITSLVEGHVYLEILATNADGRIGRVRYANGVVETHAYDATGRMVDRDVVNASGTVLLHQSHSYDVRGLLATRSAAAGGASESFSYDEARRLIRHAVNAEVRAYSYDLRGNLLQATQSGNPGYSAQFTGCPVAMPPHQPCATSERVGVFDGHSTFTYDENGRQTQARFSGVSASTSQLAVARTLEFNSFDLPRSVSRSSSVDGAVKGREYLEVTYDAFGVRTMQRSFLDRSSPVPAGVTPESTQVYIGGEFEVREQLGATTQHAFISGPEGITVEVVFDGAGAETLNRYLHRDLLGSVDLTTLGGSPTEAAIGTKQRFEAYGSRLTPSGAREPGIPGEASTRGFTGHYHDDSAGLINMQGRMYDPLQRRFLTPDPVSMYAVASSRMRSGRVSADSMSSLGGLSFAGLQGRSGSSAELQGAPGGSSPGLSDGTSYSAPGLSGSAPSTGSASRQPGEPRAVGLSYANAATSHSWEGFNPYSYAYNSPTNFVDPDGYDPEAIALGALVGGLGRGLQYAFTAPTSLTWGQFAKGAAVHIVQGALEGAAVVAAFELAAPVVTALAVRSAVVATAETAATRAATATAEAADGAVASTPVGRVGTGPITIPPGTNSPTVISGRTYTTHALDRMQGRGLTPSVVEDAIQHGESSAGRVAGTTAHYSVENHVTVITDTASGRVITTYPGRGTGH